MEVETPILQPIPGGASARPFITHHNALDVRPLPAHRRRSSTSNASSWAVSKASTSSRKNFRNEGMDRTHNPEFTCMEIYVSYKDYQLDDGLHRADARTYRARRQRDDRRARSATRPSSFKAPFRRVTMTDAIQRKDRLSTSPASPRSSCAKRARRLGVEVDETMGKGKLIDAIFGEYCEEAAHPADVRHATTRSRCRPCAKRHRDNPELTERFELLVNGKELCNAYSELNDPIDQLRTFSGAAAALGEGRRRGDVHRHGFRARPGIRYAARVRAWASESTA